MKQRTDITTILTVYIGEKFDPTIDQWPKLEETYNTYTIPTDGLFFMYLESIAPFWPLI